MKHYYYADNDLQLGPFTIEELKSKRLKKSTLVWTEGLQDWTAADSINELKEILISEPPPLPKKRNAQQTIETVQIKQVPTPVTSAKFDLTYDKETEATFFAILLIVLLIILKSTGIITFETVKSYNQNRAFIVIGSLILRIVITVWVVNIAKRQNRNSTGWGWFAFFFPLIALIVIGLLKKLRLKIELNDSLTTNEQVAFLLEKANYLFSQDRYVECVEVLNKSIEIDTKNLDCVRLRALANYQLKKFDNAKDDFKTLINSESFLSEGYHYLGNIMIRNYKRKKAVTFWQKAIEHGNKKAQVQLDLYSTYTGKYLLDKSQVIKKLTSNYDIVLANSKYLGGLDEVDQSEKLSKFKTEIKEYENGLEIKLRKAFKSYHIAIAFYEIDDIIYFKSKKNLELLLVDKRILKFEYDQLYDYNPQLKKLCIRYKEKNGKIPTALTHWKDYNCR